MSARKPAAPSERCGVSTAENSVGSIASALPSVMATDYTGNMARKTIPRGGDSRQPKRRSSGSGAAPPKNRRRRPAPPPPPATLTTWTPGEVEAAFRRFEAANPEPRGELQHQDPFTLLVAVVRSAQATDAGVNKATPKLFAVADTPQKMVALGEIRLRELIKTIGLYRTKAKNIIALSRALIAEHGGKMPFDVEQSLEAVVPEKYKRHAHHWLILHGRYVCKALKPACGRCLINDLCRWPDKNLLSV